MVTAVPPQMEDDVEVELELEKQVRLPIFLLAIHSCPDQENYCFFVIIWFKSSFSYHFESREYQEEMMFPTFDSWFTILCLVLNINDSIFNVEFLIFIIQYLMLSFWYSLFNIQHSSLSRTNSSQPADPRWDKTWHFFICLLKSMYSQSLFMCWWLFPWL